MYSVCPVNLKASLQGIAFTDVAARHLQALSPNGAGRLRISADDDVRLRMEGATIMPPNAFHRDLVKRYVSMNVREGLVYRMSVRDSSARQSSRPAAGCPSMPCYSLPSTQRNTTSTGCLEESRLGIELPRSVQHLALAVFSEVRVKPTQLIDDNALQFHGRLDYMVAIIDEDDRGTLLPCYDTELS